MSLTGVRLDLLELIAGLALTLLGSELLLRSLTRLGLKFGFGGALLGLLTALGADSPEISSALAALHAGEARIGAGVIFGSCIFNLAGLLGLPALVAGRLPISRRDALRQGIPALLTAGLAAVLAMRVAPVRPAALLLVLTFGVVVLLLARSGRPGHPTRGESAWPILLVIPAAGLLVAGSSLLVASAVAAGNALAVAPVIVGTVGLAVMTSLPNVYAGLRLALAGDAEAVFSEALNSNAINLVVGLALPALILGAVAPPGIAQAWVLAGLTAFAVAVPAATRRFGRLAGTTLAAAYVVFVAALVAGRLP